MPMAMKTRPMTIPTAEAGLLGLTRNFSIDLTIPRCARPSRARRAVERALNFKKAHPHVGRVGSIAWSDEARAVSAVSAKSDLGLIRGGNKELYVLMRDRNLGIE